MRLTEMPVRDLLTSFASSRPTPGGGSASALGSAVGASLLMMVAALPKTRADSEEDRVALAAAAVALAGVQAQLTDAIDADAMAYDQVVAAYKQPKSTDAEQSARKLAIQHALRAATDVPLNVMRLSTDALKQARVVAQHGHAPAASDTAVAIGLLAAGLHGAQKNVEANLTSVGDAAYKGAVATEVQQLVRDAGEMAEAARIALRHA